IPSRAARDTAATAATWPPGGHTACACKTNLLGWDTFFCRAERVHLGGFGEYPSRDRGLDHGVGHPLLLLYDVQATNGQNGNEFKALYHYPPDVSLRTF